MGCAKEPYQKADKAYKRLNNGVDWQIGLLFCCRESVDALKIINNLHGYINETMQKLS